MSFCIDSFAERGHVNYAEFVHFKKDCIFTLQFYHIFPRLSIAILSTQLLFCGKECGYANHAQQRAGASRFEPLLFRGERRRHGCRHRYTKKHNLHLVKNGNKKQ